MSQELTNLLRDTSRSFYVTLRVLPRKVRGQIGLAYLLARATDTIADTEAVPLIERLTALAQLRARILGTSGARLDFKRFAAGQNSAHAPTAAECLLLTRIEDALAALAQFTTADQQRIRDVLTVITSGQELDLQRFASANTAAIVSFQTEAELEDYTHRVAGCVGEFWTRMCRAHLFPDAPLDDAQLLADGVRFGKGLQLVNILRDLPRDLRTGRCYLPADQLRAAGLAPADLLQPTALARLRPVYDALLDRAGTHLAAGWAYTNALPFGQFRVRLACAWPVLIGARTVALLRRENPLDPERRVKISRAQVRGILLRSLVTSPFHRPWKRQFEQAQR